MYALLIGAILALICAVMAAGYGAYRLFQERFSGSAQSFSQRVGGIKGAATASAGPISILKQTAAAERAAARKTRVFANFAWVLEHSGLNWSFRRFGSYSAIGAIVGAVASAVAGLPLGVCAVASCAAALAPYGFAQYRSRKRLTKMEEQLPDVLDMMATMLRAGHSLPSTLALLSEQMPAPIGEEFRRLHGEMTYGNSAEDALHNLVARTRSEDIRTFVMAILVQRETGGKLTDILTDLSGVVRERLKLFGKIRTLTAEGRLSAWLLTFLPVLVGVALAFVDPDYLKFFWTDPTGKKILEAMIVMVVIGNLWMRKLIQIRV